MRIRSEQMRSLEHSIQERHKREFVNRLRRDYPEATGSLDDQQLTERTEQGYANAQELEIFSTEDIYRFLTLQFLPEDVLKSPLTQSVLIRVLNNLNLSASKRLDFIEKNVAQRRAGRPRKPA